VIKERNSFKRFEWFYRQRAFPYDTLSIHTYYYEREKEIIKEGIAESNGENVLLWSAVGPSGIISGFPAHWGQMSGRVRGIAVHPTDANIVYIGAAAGGIWKTTNGGLNWTNVGDNLASLTFGSIAIDPNDPNTVYAGAGEIMWSFNPLVYEGKGLYKTTNAGTSWTQITNGFGLQTHFGDLEVSPHNSNILFAALGSGNWYTGNLGNEGVWRSTDAGATWTRTLNTADAFDVIVHPTNANIVYASVGGGLTTAGFYVSTNGGTSFTVSNTGLPATSAIDRIQISLSTSSPTTIYAVIYDNSLGTRAYKSTNSGSSWSQISAGTQLGGTYNGSSWYDQGWYDLCIAANPSNANVVYIGNVEIHRTTNGSAFSPVRIPAGTVAWDSPMHVDYHKIVFAPSNNNVIYVGCDGGIYKSIDGGVTWTSANNGISTIQFYRIAGHPAIKNNIVGGAQDNGNFRTTDGGATPWLFTTTGDGMECLYDYSNPNNIYIATQYGNFYKSTDGGTTFNGIYFANGAWLTPLIQHPVNSSWLYTATTNVLRSTNGGSSFSTIASGVTTSDQVNTMAISRLSPSILILAGSGFFTTTPQVKVSTNGGLNWTDITANIPGAQRHVSRVLTHPNISNTMFVVKSGFSAGNKIYKSTDIGVTWSNVSGDLPDVPHNDLFVDFDNANHYYAANDLGVYRSTDGGVSWKREGIGIPFVPVIDFDYVKIGTNRWLRAATHGRSAFETDLNNILPVELTSFSANVVDENIELKWVTSTEKNNLGFELERSIYGNEFLKIAFIPGYGTSTQSQNYFYSDNNVSGLIRYRLKQIDYDGSVSYSDIIEVSLLKNLSFSLAQNYPNPFNPVTRIEYTIPEEARVKLSVFSPLGELISEIINEVQAAGPHETIWNADNLTSGIYFYTLEVLPLNGEKGFKESRKMILMK
jgi:photosystem II stability/assembly factor-like uncharacterized protein